MLPSIRMQPTFFFCNFFCKSYEEQRGFLEGIAEKFNDLLSETGVLPQAWTDDVQILEICSQPE